MGFDFEEGDPQDPFEEMREEQHEEGKADEGGGEGALPEPDSEGRKMAESAEVRGALWQHYKTPPRAFYTLARARVGLGF